MIIANDFVFVHIPKTGGTWERETLSQGPAAWEVQVKYPGHHSLNSIKVGGRMPFAFVRNPWAWHVSRAAFWSGHYASRTGGFAQPREKWSSQLLGWEQRIQGGADIPRLISVALEEMPTLSDRVETLTSHPTVQCRFGRHEALRSELGRLLRDSGAPFGERFQQVMEGRPRLMSSVHSPYRAYYDAALEGRVATAERRIIEEYGYVF